MAHGEIRAEDIDGWDSLDAIVETLEDVGFEPVEVDTDSTDAERVLRIAEDEFLTVVHAAPGETADDHKPASFTRHTNLVVSTDFETFTFISRVRNFDAHGEITHKKFSFEKGEFSGEGERRTALEKLNDLQYDSPATILEGLYDTRKVVTEFYREFEELRTRLIQQVSGAERDEEDDSVRIDEPEQRYVQVLLDRMMFLYFIQEKNLLNYDTDYLRGHHEEYVSDGEDVYEQFYEPLFFEVLGEGRTSGDFGQVPYLNGGLFSRTRVEREFDPQLGESVSERNNCFDEILTFLDGWNWHVDERLDIVEPRNLSPEILGHIFEQTVNQKEMGAYYTPEEITGFMARRTIHPYLLDQVNEAEGASYESIDEVFGLGGVADGASETPAVADGGSVSAVQAVPLDEVEEAHIEELYFEGLKTISVLDPAVGSGAFLLAAQEVLLDIYMQCLDYFRRRESFELSSRVREEFDEIDERGERDRLYAKRTIITENLYGVDIDDGAVEICKLRLWLSMVADIEDDPTEVETLPNIDFNIRQGNSLVGFVDAIDPGNNGDESTTVENSRPSTFTDFSTHEKIQEISQLYDDYDNAEGSEAVADAKETLEAQIRAYSEPLTDDLLAQAHEDGLEELTEDELEEFDPFHWMIEFGFVGGGGKFDVIIGNPPWDRLKPLRDDYFVNYDEVFRTRMPEEKDAKQAELLEDSEIEDGWEAYQEQMKLRGEYFRKSRQYELQTATVGGRTHATENDLSALFLERIFDLVAEEGYVSQILPGAIFTGSSTKKLRRALLDANRVQSLVTFENRGIFEDLHFQYNFGITTFQPGGETDSLRGMFHQTDLNILQNLDQTALEVPKRVLADYSPEAGIFPNVETEEEVAVLNSLLAFDPISKPVDGSWYAQPYRELDRTQDRDRFVETEAEGDYPVLGGSNIYQYSYDPTFVDNLEEVKFWSVDEDVDSDRSAKRRIREKNYRRLKRGLYDAFDGDGSQKSFVNDLLENHRGSGLTEKDVKLDCTEYRLVYRDVARASDERTMIAGVIPQGVVCHNTIHTVRPLEIAPDRSDLDETPLHGVYERVFSDQKELFVALGLLNSIPFDFLMRTKIDTHIVMYKFEESQVPHLTDGDDWFHYIADRAARLNCYGEQFQSMRETLGIEPVHDPDERERLQAEIDAAACHAYGLDSQEVEYILTPENFGTVSNPRRMTDEYFTLVAEQYHELADDDPRP